MGIYPGGNIIRVTTTLSTSAYTGGDVMWDATEIPNAVSSRGGVSKLLSVSILIDNPNDADIDLVFMQVQTNLGTINEAAGSDSLWTDALAKAAKVIGTVQLNMNNGDTNLQNNKVVTYGGNSGDADLFNQLPMLLQAEGGSTSIYVAGINRVGSQTYGADDIQLILHVEYLN